MKKLLLTLTLLLTLGFAASAYEDNILLEFLKDGWDHSKANSSYTSAATSNDGKWQTQNFNFNNEGWHVDVTSPAYTIKCGSKSAISTAKISSLKPIDQAITKVTINIPEIASTYVNSITLHISDDANFSNPKEVKLTSYTTGDNSFAIEEPNAGKYYQVVISCKKHNSKNGFVAVNNVKFFYEVEDDNRQSVELAWTPESAKLNIGDAFVAPALTAKINGEENADALAAVEYTIENEALLKQENGTFVLTPNMTGTATITASIPEANESYVCLTPVSYTLKVIDPNAGFVLVTDAANIYDGAKGYIVCTSSKAIMGAQNSNYRDKVDLAENAIIDGMLVDVPESATLVTFEKFGDKFKLKVGDKYLSCTNQKSLTESDSAEGTITVASNGDASIELLADFRIEYNASSPRFACYKYTMQALQIYIEPIKLNADNISVTDAEGNAVDANSVYPGTELKFEYTDAPAGLTLTPETYTFNGAEDAKVIVKASLKGSKDVGKNFSFKSNHLYTLDAANLKVKMADGTVLTAGEAVELPEGTKLTVVYEGAPEDAVITYKVGDSETAEYTFAGTEDVTILVSAKSRNELATAKYILCTERPMPEFNVEDGANVFVGQEITVTAEGAEDTSLSVNGTPLSGTTTYTVAGNVGDRIELKAEAMFDSETGEIILKEKTITVTIVEPTLVISDVTIKHGKVAGVITVKYMFEIANHNGNELDVTATLEGNSDVTFVKVETPAAAPARVDGQNPQFEGTLKATHESLKGAQTLRVNVKATLDGKELYNKTETDIPTTGIEDVTVEGNEAAEYFNLQGIRVAEPQAGQVYIVRRGAKTTKELVK